MLIGSRLPYQCQQNLGKFYGLNRKSNMDSFIYLTDAQLDCSKKNVKIYMRQVPLM